MITKAYFKEIFEKNNRQDPVIDAIRGLSVLSIIAFHVLVGITQIYQNDRLKEFILGLPGWLQPIWHFEKGVDAFFLISALVLGLPLFKKINTFDWATAKSFYKKRFFRIYPLFFVALLLYTAAQWSYFGKYFFSNLLLINNLLPGERTIIPVGWSLLVEVQYYALVPLLFFVLRKSLHRGKVLATLVILSVVASALILMKNSDLYLRPLTDIFLAPDHDSFTSRLGELFYQSNLARFGPFAIGLLLAYLKVTYPEKLKALFHKAGISAASLLVMSALLVYSLTLPLYNPNSWYYNPASSELNFLVLASIRQAFAIGVSLLILACWYSDFLFFKMLTKIFSLRLWSPLSRLSFPIYLFHFPFIAVSAVIVFGTTKVKEIEVVTFGQGVSIFFLATALTILFSIPLYIYVERPFIERGKKT